MSNTLKLTKDSLYVYYGTVCIAVNETDLLPLSRPNGSNHYLATDGATEHYATVGSDTWIAKMVEQRDALARDLENERADLRRKQEYIHNLGQAILEKANEHEWCSEYDEFAAEWGLPSRRREYRVTMYVTVEATDEDQARETVAGEVHLDPYSVDGVLGHPDFEVEEVY